MMKITGFLAGICLTLAAFVLVPGAWDKPQPEIVTETVADPTPEDLSAVAEAIAEQVDVVQAETESDIPLPPTSGPGPAETEPPASFVEATVDEASQEPSEVSRAMAGQADVVQVEHESSMAVPPDDLSATTGNQLQSDFEAPSLELDHGPTNQATTDDFEQEDSHDTGTYMFWSPFRSTWAAQGFAGRLALATQVPVDVINTGPGKYRVAFVYRDETERLARIERIETITGLKLE